MILIQRILFLFLLLVLGVAVFQNQAELGRSVDFAFMRWRMSFVLGFWMLFSFLAGGFLFLLLDAWRSLRLRLEIRRRDQQIAKLEQEAAMRKNAPPPSGGFSE